MRKFKETRPLTSRIQTSLFDILKEKIPSSSFLDLFAGKGRAGLEALRRGAKWVVFVEKNPQLTREIRGKICSAGWEERSRIITGDVFRVVRELAREGEKFDLIFIDPPFSSGLGKKLLNLSEFPLLFHEDSLGIIREYWRDAVSELDNFQICDKRRYGENSLTFFILRR